MESFHQIGGMCEVQKNPERQSQYCPSEGLQLTLGKYKARLLQRK
jgi:hypothetical protein